MSDDRLVDVDINFNPELHLSNSNIRQVSLICGCDKVQVIAKGILQFVYFSMSNSVGLYEHI